MTDSKSAGATTDSEEGSDGFSAAERAAIRERAQEVRAAKRTRGKKVNPEAALLEKIAEMPQPDRGMAERIHAVVMTNAPDLQPKLWYGMPAYALDGKVVCFFQPAQKFDTRYSTLGFNDIAALDDGDMWPAAYALTKITPAVEKKIAALVKKAVG
jgi:uncharacterized protein YdhG (YjbR/CyaY superfamily)